MKQIVLMIFCVSITIHLMAQDFDLEYSPEVQVLGGQINTDLPEVKPLISPDGKTLYFSRRNSPDNIQGTKDFQDIWVSHIDESGGWTEATNLGGTVNDKHANAICAVSQDGKIGIFYNTYRKLEHPLAKAIIVNNQWSQPEPVIIEDYYNYNQYSDFYTCFRTNVLLMSIEREDSQGDQDLYISLMNDQGNYGKPINLGNMINTSRADFAPFLAADGETMFFASYGHGGFGGSDIYMCKRLDDSWLKWSAPVNLGPVVNTQHNETYFSLTADFKHIYLDSFSPLGEQRDIVKLDMPDELKPRRFRNATLMAKVSYQSSSANSRFLLKD